MSHRTNHLPPAKGLHHVIRELRYHEASRQLLALAYILVLALLARPLISEGFRVVIPHRDSP